MGLLTDYLEKEINKKHQADLDQDAQMRAFHFANANDDALHPAVQDHSRDQWLSLLPPKTRKVAQTGMNTVGLLKKVFLGGPQPAEANTMDKSPVAAAPVAAPTLSPGQENSPTGDADQADDWTTHAAKLLGLA